MFVAFKMNTLFWLLVLCTHEISSTMIIKDISRLDYTFHVITRNLKSKQLSIFTNSTPGANKKQSDAFARLLVSRFAATTIDLSRIKNTEDNRSLQLPVFKNPRSSTVYVLLQSKDLDLSQIYNILDDLVAISPISMRPKSLLVLHSDENWSELDVPRILRYAWTLKFLDFSILKIDTGNRIALLQYNPFTETYNRFNSNIPKVIFPDKLNDVKGFLLKLPFMNSPPYVMMHKTSNNEIDATGSDFLYIKTVADKLNFILNFPIEIHDNTDEERTKKVFTNLESNDISATPDLFLVSTIPLDRKLIIGNSIGQTKIAVIVPIISVSSLKYSSDIPIYILSFAAVIFSFAIPVHLMKFKSDHWGTMNIFQILIGMPIADQPRQIVERIVFFTIAVLSMSYSGLLISKLAEIEVVRGEKDFTTFEDIEQSGIPLYTRYFATDEDDMEIQQLFSNSGKVDNDEDCIDMLIETRYVICIMEYDRANYIVPQHLDVWGMPIMKIVDELSFRVDRLVFAYEKASPYAEEFDKVSQLLRESGIPIFWETRIYNGTAKIHQMSTSESSSTSIQDILVIQLMIILFIGCLLSITIFIYELVHSYVTWMSTILNLS